jgi:hypothetical protein
MSGDRFQRRRQFTIKEKYAMQPKALFSFCSLFPLLIPLRVSALTVDIQGVLMEPELAGASCVEIEGEYPGVRIDPSAAGKSARICYDSAKVNSISILNATFVALDPVKKDISIKFEHSFPPGINGKIMARARLQGFFSTADGVGIPTGDKVSLTPLFAQSGHDDEISEPFKLTVSDQADSALFEYYVKKQYVIAGPRKLKGELKFAFSAPGHKLTLQEKCGISLDTGSTFEDKLDTLDTEETPEVPAEGVAPDSGVPIQGLPSATPPGPPAGTIPFPAPSGGSH